MVISSNTLFHFTDNINNLIDILTNEFRPHISLEIFGDIFSGADIGNAEAIPMVSFCDLPLSQVKDHVEFYGNYGIGLSKEWGIANGVNPVMYLEPRSYLKKHFLKLLEISDVKVDKDILSTFFEIASFVKIYKGICYRKGKYLPDIIFYNEREWRFVPLRPEGMLPEKFLNSFFMSAEEFLDEQQRESVNSRLRSAFKLSFEPNSIKYIIVSNENEILPMVKAIKEIKGNKYSYDLLQILTTRVISASQIKEDF
jgi:hypothetical protein